MKKNSISIILVLLLIMCNCMTVMADTTTWNGSTYTGDSQKNVKATLVKDAASTVYSVNIVWGDMKYVYDSKMTWDTGSMSYIPVDSTVTSWSLLDEGESDADDEYWEDGKVSIQNASEAKVYVSASYSALSAGEPEMNAVVGGCLYTNAAMTNVYDDVYTILGTAADSESDALDLNLYLNVVGSIISADTEVVDSGTKLGSVTISLSDKQPTIHQGSSND